MSFVDALFQRRKPKEKGDPEALIAAVADLERSIELFGEMWKAVVEVEHGPGLANKINLPVLAAECLKANGLQRVLDKADTFGPGIADITERVRRVL